jgi:hypothetical protein
MILINLLNILIQLLIIWLNKLINLLKYPIAILLLIGVPFLIPKFFEVLQIMLKYKEHYYPMLWGMGIYILAWQILFKNIGNGWFATLEHELTHILFAVVTFHKITDLKASFTGNGHMHYSGVGGGNWLITISPYFFPTFSAMVLSLSYLSKHQFDAFFLGLLGFSIVYHIHSTYRETHYGQSDLKKVGIGYAWLFLPSANLLAFVMLLALIPNDRIHLSTVMSKFYIYYLNLITVFDNFF